MLERLSPFCNPPSAVVVLSRLREAISISILPIERVRWCCTVFPVMSPEEKARQEIDALLTAAGWSVQNYKQFSPGTARGIALRDVPLASGECDYLLLVDRQPVGVIEARRVGKTLSTVADQSAHYAANLPAHLAARLPSGVTQLPFLYEFTGVETFFRDERDPHPRSRHVFAFHQPETLAAWLKEPQTLRARLAALPTAHPLSTDGMRACQVEAITKLEESFAADRPRALIQMATDAGKSFTACAATYRLIKHAGARRVLFLVDRANIGCQGVVEFRSFVTPDSRKPRRALRRRRAQANLLTIVPFPSALKSRLTTACFRYH